MSGPTDNIMDDILSTTSSISVPSLNPIVLSDVGATGPQATEVPIEQAYHTSSNSASLAAEPLEEVITTSETSDTPDVSCQTAVVEDVGPGPDDEPIQTAVNTDQSGGTSVSLPKIDIGVTAEPSGASAEQQGEVTNSQESSEEASEGPLEQK